MQQSSEQHHRPPDAPVVQWCGRQRAARWQEQIAAVSRAVAAASRLGLQHLSLRVAANQWALHAWAMQQGSGQHHTAQEAPVVQRCGRQRAVWWLEQMAAVSRVVAAVSRLGLQRLWLRVAASH